MAALLRSLGGRSVTALVAERSGSSLPAASILLLEHLDAAGTQRVSQIAQCQKVGVPAITPRLKDLESAGCQYVVLGPTSDDLGQLDLIAKHLIPEFS